MELAAVLATAAAPAHFPNPPAVAGTRRRQNIKPTTMWLLLCGVRASTVECSSATYHICIMILFKHSGEQIIICKAY